MALLGACLPNTQEAPHKSGMEAQTCSSTGARSQENPKSGVILAYTVSLRQALNMRHCFKKEREREKKISKKEKRTAKTALPAARCKTADYTHRCH